MNNNNFLSVTIMAHRNRARFVEELAPQLGRPKIVWDQGNGLWDTARRAWLSYDENADWHLVVQDDAIICDKFLEIARVALSHVSTSRPVSFYTGAPRPHAEIVETAWAAAVAKGASWLEMEGPWWGVAYALPVSDIQYCVAWADAWAATYRDERRIAACYAERGVRCWYTVPCLVDHRDETENPSLIEGHLGSRRARWFISENADEVDWSTPPVTEKAQVSYP